MNANYKIGDRVKLSDAGLENVNYASYVNAVLIVSHVARSEREHPGFDRSAGTPLYDFHGCPFSLYEWEFIPA